MGQPMVNKVNAAISEYLLLMQYETDTVSNIQRGTDTQIASRSRATRGLTEKRKMEDIMDNSNQQGVYTFDNPKFYDRPRTTRVMKKYG